MEYNIINGVEGNDYVFLLSPDPRYVIININPDSSCNIEFTNILANINNIEIN